MSDRKKHTISELVDHLDGGRARQAARRRIQCARQELADTAERLAELAEQIPTNLDAMTTRELRDLLAEMRLSSNCLAAEADTAALSLDELIRTEHEITPDDDWSELLDHSD